MFCEIVLGNQYEQLNTHEVTEHLEELKIHGTDVEDEDVTIRKFEVPRKRLMNRIKWSNLAYDEQLHIYRENTTQNKSISCIWQEYGISSTTVKRIAKIFNMKLNRSEIYTKIRCRSQIKQKFVQDAIKEFVDKRCSPFFASEVQRHIKLELGILLSLHQIRCFIKTSLNLSYKKGNKRPLNLDRERYNLLQQLFAVMLAKQLPNTVKPFVQRPLCLTPPVK